MQAVRVMLRHHIGNRFAKPESLGVGIDPDGFSRSRGEIVLTLIVGPQCIGLRGIGLSPSRNAHCKTLRKLSP